MDPAVSFLAADDQRARKNRVTDGVVGNARPTHIVIPAWLPRSIGAFLAGWLTLSGGLLYVRASLDATQPLRSGQLVLAAVGLMAAAWFSRMALDFAGTGLSRMQRRLSLRETAFFRGAKDDAVLRKAAALQTSAWHGAVVTLGLLLWGLALTKVGTSALAVGLYWLLFVAEESWAWHRQFLYFWRPTISHPAEAPRAPDDQIIQQFTRALTADGEEVIHGSLAMRIERGSRMGAAHIAFCPPFAGRPQFDAHFAESQNAALKVTQLHPYGARVEVRLPQAAQADANLFVQFAARA